ncbi:hypothetical protein A4D02_00325 [Niastella koreensis]|uniref:Uncharacterized protein n=2 Tax=Niastella koreensis TaxID=354356 RepID=G8TA61_NIAKG|nr:hypothetical protein [Niastella koreensis]AEW02433.1 hypothetical protein Niako_6208 [Niastella koreensis GR20-10]OQP54807.1 hypothetical protein A4D02_00325 [Niastella koreensis]
MKNYSIIAIALVAFTLAFSNTTLANNEGPNNKHVTDLKFVGNKDNQPVFELSLNSAIEDEYTVTFRDEYGNVFYTDKLKGASLTKKFMLKSEEFGDAALHVVVRSKNNNSTEVYAINRSHSYVEETVVNKVK